MCYFLCSAVIDSIEEEFKGPVRLAAEGDQLELEIADDGVGFDRDAGGDTGGMGLANMHQRAVQLGGILDIVSSPGKGTRIRAAIPRNAHVSP